jgi:carbonic anhydrase
MSAIDDHISHAQGRALPPPANLPTQPRRRLALLTCMDSRIDAFAVLGLEIGDAHVLRNAGGIVTEDVIRSLTLSRWLLGTEEILVLQHTRCGLHRLDEAGLKARIEASGATVPFTFGSFDDVAESVRDSMRQLVAEPLLARGIVRGAVYDVDTGGLVEVRPDSSSH